MLQPRRLTIPFAFLFLVAGPACSDDSGTLFEPEPLPAPESLAVPTTADPLLGGLISGVGGLVGGTVGGLTGLVGGLVEGLLGCPVERTYTASESIGYWGGTLQVGPHELYVPRGALSQRVTITAVAPAGNYAQVDFEPEGLTFDRPVALKLSYEECGSVDAELLRVVYVDDAGEIAEVLPSMINRWDESVTGLLDHFSVYALAD
ncbi:MAG: hypothetical protein ACRENI_02855 [Gemmatimonadaceae bacterium]